MSDPANNIHSQAELSDDERALLDAFLSEHQRVYGPDPEIMRNHGLMPRSAIELRGLSGELDVDKVNLVRSRIASALEEGYNMVEKMGVAPCRHEG